MKFEVNTQRKATIKKSIKFDRKSVYIAYLIEKIVLFIAIVGPMLFFIINAFDPTAYIGNVRGEIRKNYDVLILITAIAMGMLLTTWILVRTLRVKLSSVHTAERVEETMEIMDSRLIYTFRIKYQFNFDERNVVVIDMESLEKLDYETETQKLIIKGKMVERCINISDVGAEVDMSNAESREIIIYDYFEPSLEEYIKNKFKNTIMFRYIGNERKND